MNNALALCTKEKYDRYNIVLEELKIILVQAINKHEIKCTGSINTLFHSVDITSTDGETRLYIKCFNNKLIVSNIMFKDRHRGHGTKVFEELVKLCKEHKLDGILVISILTPEMKGLCEKFNFKITDGTKNFLCENYYGDYYLSIGE